MMAFSNEFISHELEPGELFCDRYRIQRRIADGGMASIYLAIDESTRVEVAIKVLFSYYSDNAVIRARFLDEGRIQAMLRHPNIVHVYRVVTKPLLCFVMEFVDGETLEDYLKKAGALEEREVLEVMLPVLSAIGMAHSKGIIHRDLKPSNILVQQTPQGLVPKVMDFGVAKVTSGRDLTAAGTTVGTLHYMSPEQIVGSRSIDGRADIYSLGVTLYKLVTGEVPFNASTEFALMMAQVEAAPAAPSTVREGVSRRMESIILRALEKEPARRYQSIKEFTSALMSLGEDPDVMDTDTMSIPRELLEYAMMADEVAKDRTAQYTMEHLAAAGLLSGNSDADTIEFGEPTQELSFRFREEIRADARHKAREPAVNETMELDEADIADLDETMLLSRPEITVVTPPRDSHEFLHADGDTDGLADTQEMISKLRDSGDLGATQEMPQRVREGAAVDRKNSGAISVEVTDAAETVVSKRWTTSAANPSRRGGVVGLDRGADSQEVTKVSWKDPPRPAHPTPPRRTALEDVQAIEPQRISAKNAKRDTARMQQPVPIAGFATGTAGLNPAQSPGQSPADRKDADGNLEPITSPERPSAYAHLAQMQVKPAVQQEEAASYLRPQGGHTEQTRTAPETTHPEVGGIPRWLIIAGLVVLLGVVLIGVIAAVLAG